jgi:hypothetical protein
MQFSSLRAKATLATCGRLRRRSRWYHAHAAGEYLAATRATCNKIQRSVSDPARLIPP